jgi:integrase
MLKRWIQENGLKGDDLLFPGKDGRTPMWPGVWLQKHVQRIAKQLDIAVPVTFQVLRRSFATRHRNELKDAQDVLGHANYATTTANVYAQSVAESVIAMLEED